MSNVSQIGLRVMGIPVEKTAANTCQISCGGTSIACENVTYSLFQNIVGIILRWLINMTGIGAIVLWLVKSIYGNAESDATSATQAVVQTYQEIASAEKEQDSEKRESRTQKAHRISGKWGFSARANRG
ncbi:MAG: hypothetical protein LBI34_00685 [Puniceicoccales bacterium]|nr:hypothetical protein [Puniceicoccales bacterium]